MNFEEKIKKHFNFLFSDYGFRISKNNLDKDVKDFVVFASGRGICLKFINDRADFFLDVSSEATPEKWVEFYKFLGQLKDKGYIPGVFKISNKINNVKTCLKSYFDVIESNIHLLK